MSKFITFLFIATYAFSTISIYVGAKNVYNSSRCPEEHTITPCQCTYWEDSDLIDLDCSLVDSEEQLYQIFNSDLNITEKTTFYMGRNHNIKILRDGVFGSVCFVDIIVMHGSLEVVEAGALTGSQETTKILKFVDNKIYDFPFHVVEYMPSLNILDLSQNNISIISMLNNNKTTEVSFRSNPLGNIQTGTFQNLPSLKRLDLENTSLANIGSGILGDLSCLDTVYLAHNDLTQIQEGTFARELVNLHRVDLSDNDISLIEPHAFQVLKGLDIDLYQNEVTILDELVWRPLFDIGISFNINNNPLACGCDIAWLWMHPYEYLPQVGDAQCAQGIALQDIDPNIFDDC